MRSLIIILIGLGSCIQGYGQDYTSLITGDTIDVTVSVSSAIVLAGGGSDNDDAMKWMLNRAKGGDVVVIRTSGSSGYNNYFLNELGVNINSVETIVFRNRNASFDPYVVRRLGEAEIIFIAGGDQTVYYQYWKESPVSDILNSAITNKDKVIGGTSAGMMILANIAYLPLSSGVTSAEALSDPFHPFINDLKYSNFVQSDLFEKTIFDTHFDNRNRAGRLVAFIARATQDSTLRIKAIACNESTALCIDENGVAHVFGEYPQYNDFAYFIQANCSETGLPQEVKSGKPLQWIAENGKAVVVQKVAGFKNGNPQFDIKSWNSLTGDAVIEYWQVNQGVLEKKNGSDKSCEIHTSGQQNSGIQESMVIFPNPVSGTLHIPRCEWVVILNAQGKIIFTGNNISTIDTNPYPAGHYIMQISIAGKKINRQLIIGR